MHLTLKLKIKSFDSDNNEVLEDLKRLQSTWERRAYNACIELDLNPNKSTNSLINQIQGHTNISYPKGYSWFQLSAIAGGIDKYKKIKNRIISNQEYSDLRKK